MPHPASAASAGAGVEAGVRSATSSRYFVSVIYFGARSRRQLLPIAGDLPGVRGRPAVVSKSVAATSNITICARRGWRGSIRQGCYMVALCRLALALFLDLVRHFAVAAHGSDLAAMRHWVTGSGRDAGSHPRGSRATVAQRSAGARPSSSSAT